MITKVITGITIPALAALILWLTAAPAWAWAILALFVIIDAGLIARAARIDAQR
jgi:hypothetical protein